MHELGIASNVLEIIGKAMESRPGARLRRATVRVGDFSGVDPESLQFSLEVLAKDAGFEGAVFLLERSPDDALDLTDLELEVP
jgi:hydrogenase nickel incorporation protein HypA/HybF